MEIESLKPILKTQIVQYLNLLDVNPEDIKDDEPLFGGSLELDSIDSLELVVLLEREYGIKINNPAEGRKILVDINTMAEYILQNKKEIEG
jgi:acyl carrier protein